MAKMSAGKLSMMLSAKTGKFKKDMKGAGKSVGRFSRVVKGSSKRLLGFGTAMLGIAGAGGFLALMKSSLNSMDNIGKLSDEIGIATEKLVAYQHGAKIAGSSVEVLNKGLQYLAKTIGETVTGISTEGKLAFDLLGLSVEKLEKQSPADTFKEVAETLSRIESPARRMAFAQRLFGRAGKDMMTMLMGGSKALSHMEKEAIRLGIAFDRQLHKKAEDANDSITNFTAAVGGLSSVLALIATDSIIKLTTDLAAYTASMSKAAGGTNELNLELYDTIKAIGMIGKAIIWPFKKIKEFGELLGGTVGVAYHATVGTAARGIQKTVEGMGGEAEGLKAFADEQRINRISYGEGLADLIADSPSFKSYQERQDKVSMPTPGGGATGQGNTGTDTTNNLLSQINNRLATGLPARVA
jgi:hypothetical protein